MSVQDALLALGKDVGILEPSVIDELFGDRLLQREKRSVRAQGEPGVHADPVLPLEKERERFQTVHDVPIEQMAVRKIGAQLLQHAVIVRRALHQALIVFEKVILMIAHDAHGVGQRKQKVGKTDALRALVDEVAQDIEGVPFAKFDFLQQAAYDAVTAVRIGKTVLHDKIIPHSRTFDKENPPSFRTAGTLLQKLSRSPRK